MPPNFITTDQASRVNGVKMLVYSPGGHGKSILTATLPKPFLISVENGLLSLARKNIERTFGANRDDICYNIPGVEVKSYADILDVYNFITTSEHAKQFASLSLDSISELAEIALSTNKGMVKDVRKAYGDTNDQIANLVRMFRDIPGKHVYFAAKQDREKDEQTGMQLYGPSMPGKTLTQGIEYFFDEVFYLGIAETPDKTKYRFLRTRPDPQYKAKDRSGALDEFEEPHLGKVINKIVSNN